MSRGSRIRSFPSGSGGRLRLLLVVATVAFAVDQATKVGAAAFDPGTYVQNPDRHFGPLWDLGVVAALACLLPFRLFALACGLFVGGACGNVVDAYVWPGGVPDFLDTGWPEGVWNVADLFIVLGAALFGLAVVVWPVRGLWRRIRAAVEEPNVVREAPPAALLTRGPV